MKFVKFALVVAMALCLTASVYAETQSVKVSGDLAVRGIWRSDYELRGSAPKSGEATGSVSGLNRTGATADTNLLYGPQQSWWMSTTEVQIDAALTDNVSTVIRIANERDWNVTAKAINQNTSIAPNGFGGYTGNSDDFQIGLDLAYVTLKNFIYSPLSVTIGRQDLWFGKGFIVGSNQVYNNYSAFSSGDGLEAAEYTTFTAFDSIKATLDYDPWTISAIYSKIQENATANFDDIDLYGVNAGYKFDNYKAEAEGYWFWKQDRSVEQFFVDSKAASNNDVHTIGMRGSFDPIENVTIAGEGAYQLGNYVGDRSQTQSIARSAWAFDISAEYRGFMEKFSWKPKMGVEYIYYSGQSYDGSTTSVQSQGTYHGWDRMFRGKYDSAIREWVGTYYQTYDYRANGVSGVSGIPTQNDASFTNQNQFIFSGSVQPMESVTLKGNANLFWLNEPILASNPGISQSRVGRQDQTKGYIGTEFDFQGIWDYTEDVSFGLLMAWFVPGESVYENAAKTSQDIVGTCKVSF